MRLSFLTSVAVLGLTACTSIVPATVMQLNRLDPFSADPADFAALLEPPTGLALQPNSVKLNLDARHSPSGQTWDESYTLVEARDGEGRVTYVLSPDDIAQLLSIQAEINALRSTSDGNSSGSFGISADPCRVANVAVGDDPRLSLFVRFQQDGAFRPLIRDGSIIEFFEIDDLEDLERLPTCGEGPF